MRRLVTLVALTVLALVVTVAPATAHNVLVDSDPPDGASLETGPPRVSLTFDLPVQPGFSVVTVTGPDGEQWQAGPPVEDGSMVSVPVRELGPAGEYVIGYQVLSSDSHPVRGVVSFTLTTPGPDTAGPAPGTDRDAPASGDPDPGAAGPGDAGTDDVGDQPEAEAGSDGTPVWPWLIGAGLLLAAGVSVALKVGRSG